jgi:hypothetical protein
MDAQADQDAQHLNLLSIFHYVVAAMMALWACFPILHFVLGAAMVFGAFGAGKPGEPSPAWVGWFFMLFAAAWILFGWALAIATFIAGRSLAKRKWRVFCLVMAVLMAVTCMPFGTVLGVFTIIVLVRPSVQEAFAATPGR